MSVDRMKLLELAMAKANDGREALFLAQQMAEFVEGQQPAPLAQPAPPAPASVVHLHVKPEAQQSARVAGVGRYKGAPPNAGRHWSAEDVARAGRMLDDGASVEAVADALGRNVAGVKQALRDGKVKSRNYNPNPAMVIAGAATALKRGWKLDPETVAHVNGLIVGDNSASAEGKPNG